MGVDDCISRTARRAIDSVGDPSPPPVVPCGHCQMCTPPRPIPAVLEARGVPWEMWAGAAAVGAVVALIVRRWL